MSVRLKVLAPLFNVYNSRPIKYLYLGTLASCVVSLHSFTLNLNYDKSKVLLSLSITAGATVSRDFWMILLNAMGLTLFSHSFLQFPIMRLFFKLSWIATGFAIFSSSANAKYGECHLECNGWDGSCAELDQLKCSFDLTEDPKSKMFWSSTTSDGLEYSATFSQESRHFDMVADNGPRNSTVLYRLRFKDQGVKHNMYYSTIFGDALHADCQAVLPGHLTPWSVCNLALP